MRETTEWIRYSYFLWLVNEKIGPIFSSGASFFMLYTVLFHISYYWVIWQDDSRIGDAMKLRDEFVGEDLELAKKCNWEVSVLEVLVSLAYRLEKDNYQDDRYLNRAPLWFRYMITNPGLDRYDDEKMKSKDYEVEVIMKVQDILEHKFDELGTGSFFPLHELPKIPATEMTLWGQANAWFIQNELRIEVDSEAFKLAA